MMRRVRGSILASTAFVAVAMLVLSDATLAQVPSASSASSEVTIPAAATTIDEVTLDKFVDAFLAVQKIQKESVEGNKEISEQRTARAREAEMQTKMVDAVQKSGLQIEEFNRISQLMLQDQDLRARVSAKLQVKGKQGG